MVERDLFDMMFSAYTPTVFTADETGLERSHYVAWIELFLCWQIFIPTPQAP